MAPRTLFLYGGVHYLNVSKGKLVLRDALADTVTTASLTDRSGEQVVIGGALGSVSFSALRWLGARGVPLTSIDFDGKLLGVWTPRGPSRPENRLAQLETHLDPERRLNVARSFVTAKVVARRALLERSKRLPRDVSWDEAAVRDATNLRELLAAPLRSHNPSYS